MDRKPDPEKQTEECKKLEWYFKCKNMKETGGGFEGEQYYCEVCGAAVYLDYEEMKMQVTFKDPDTLIDTIDEAKRDLVRELMEELKLSKNGAEAEAEERLAKMNELAHKFFQWHEYVTIELDDETMTARVVPVNE